MIIWISESKLIKMDELDVIIENLISELEGDDSSFKEIVNLSRTNLHSQNVRNPREYFDLLENNLGREDMLDFLTNVTDFQNLHIIFGTRNVADTLKECKSNLEKLKRQWMRKNIFDSNFIGRDEEINDIMNNLVQNRDVTGVSLWGAGGIGKTSIGNEVCRRLWALSRFWEVIKIDLRGKSSMGDLLKDIILELQKKDDQTMSDKDTDDLQNSLKDTMDSKMQAIILQYLGNISHRTVVMLDNVDDVLCQNYKLLLVFIKMLLKKLQGNCKVRVIITSRVSLMSNNSTDDLGDLMYPVEVKKLQAEHAKELIRKCTPIGLVSGAEEDSLVKVTDGIPLALRTVCSILKNCYGQVKAAALIHHMRSSDEKLALVGMETCLQESFDRLDIGMQEILMQLTIFKMSPFDLDAAEAVLKADGALPTNLKLFHLKRYHLVEIQDTTIQTEGNRNEDIMSMPKELKDNNRKVLYSLHPLVYQFLNKRKDEFEEVLVSAKERFFKYMERIISIIAKERTDFYSSVAVCIREYSIHIQSYFDIAVELSRNQKAGIFQLDVKESSRISEIGRLVLSKDRQLEWLKWIIRGAERNHQVEQEIFFRGYMIQLQTEMSLLPEIPSTIDATEKKTNTRRLSPGMKVALGNFHHKKALYFKKINERIKAMESLKKAQQYLEDKSIEPLTYAVMMLANVYNDFGCMYYQHDSDKCMRYHEKAVSKALEAEFCEDHPDVDMFKTNRAVCQLSVVLKDTLEQSTRDRYIEEALTHFNDVIKKHRQRGTDTREEYALALRNRSVLYLELKHYEESLSDAKMCLEVRKAFLKEPHEDLTLSYSNIAHTFYYWGGYELGKRNIGKGMEHFKDAIHYYDLAFERIEKGGLSIDQDGYADIKKYHLLAVKRADRNRKQHLEQEYQELEYRRSVTCGREDSGNASSDNDDQNSSSDSLSSDLKTDSSEDEQQQDRQPQGEHKEIVLLTPKTEDLTFQTPLPKGKGIYEHQDSGYISGSSTSSYHHHSSHRLWRQESFEDLGRPRLKSNLSGSSEVCHSSCLTTSMNELMQKVNSRKSYKSKGRSSSQQYEVIYQREKLVRGNSDPIIRHKPQSAHYNIPSKAMTERDEGQGDPVSLENEGQDDPVSLENEGQDDPDSLENEGQCDPVSLENDGLIDKVSVIVQVTGKRNIPEDTETPMVPEKLLKKEIIPGEGLH